MLDPDLVLIEVADIYLLGAGVFHRQAKNEQASQWCQKSREIARKIDTHHGKRSLAQAYYLDGAVLYRVGDFVRSLEQCAKSLKIYHEIGDVVGEARAFNNISNSYADLGEWEQAMDALQKSLEINHRIGNIFEQGNVANNLACIHLERGEWDLAKDLFMESNLIWKKIGATFPDAVTLSNLAQVHINQENWNLAKENLEESQVLFEAIGSDDYLAELERRWGEYYLGVGDVMQALAHSNRSLQLADEQDSPLDMGMSLRILGLIQVELGKLDQAKEALLRSQTTLDALGSEYELAKTTLELTNLALKMGEEVDPTGLENAIRTFESLGEQIEITRARALLDEID